MTQSRDKWDYIAQESSRASKAIQSYLSRPHLMWEDYLRVVPVVGSSTATIMSMATMINRLRHMRPTPTTYDREMVTVRLLAEMARTLATGKLTRISSMYMADFNQEYDFRVFDWQYIIGTLFPPGRPTHASITGGQGSGKTHLAVWLTNLLLRIGKVVSTNITIEFPAKDGKKRPRHIDKNYRRVHRLSDVLAEVQYHHADSVLIIDETGINWSHADVQSRKNKNMGKIVRVMRKLGLSIIIIDQLYRTIPREFQELSPIQFHLQNRKCIVKANNFMVNINHIIDTEDPRYHYRFDTRELPSFAIDVNPDDFLEQYGGREK